MRLQLTVMPIKIVRRINSDVARLIDLLDAMGVEYQKIDFGALVKCTREQWVEVVSRCQELMRPKRGQVMVLIKVEDDGGMTGGQDGRVGAVARRPQPVTQEIAVSPSAREITVRARHGLGAPTGR